MFTSNCARLYLFLALVTSGGIASAVFVHAAGSTVGTWLVQHGVVGVWGKAAVFLVGAIYFFLLIEGSSRLAYLGTPTRTGPRSVAFLAFFLGGSVLLAVWLITAHYLAQVIAPFVGASLDPWLETLLLMLGALAVGALGDRLAPRFGINVPRGRRL